MESPGNPTRQHAQAPCAEVLPRNTDFSLTLVNGDCAANGSPKGNKRSKNALALNADESGIDVIADASNALPHNKSDLSSHVIRFLFLDSSLEGVCAFRTSCSK